MKWYYWIGVIVFAILGITTLIPAPASKLLLLDYYAHCSFTPISTIICWIMAGAIYRLGNVSRVLIHKSPIQNPIPPEVTHNFRKC